MFIDTYCYVYVYKAAAEKGKKARTMTEEAREARNRYAREWYRKNTEKVKSYMQRYWERKAQREAERAAAEDAEIDRMYEEYLKEQEAQAT